MAPTEPELLAELLERVSAALGLEASASVETRDGALTATLHGEELGLFVGRHGQTIDAVQHLAQRAVATLVGEQRRVVVDAEGYRRRRQEALESQAAEAADLALREGRPVPLAAMTAGERRLVHEFLRDRGGVETHSEGEEPDRRLVVSPPSRCRRSRTGCRGHPDRSPVAVLPQEPNLGSPFHVKRWASLTDSRAGGERRTVARETPYIVFRPPSGRGHAPMRA